MGLIQGPSGILPSQMGSHPSPAESPIASCFPATKTLMAQLGRMDSLFSLEPQTLSNTTLVLPGRAWLVA